MHRKSWGKEGRLQFVTVTFALVAPFLQGLDYLGFQYPPVPQKHILSSRVDGLSPSLQGADKVKQVAHQFRIPEKEKINVEKVNIKTSVLQIGCYLCFGFHHCSLTQQQPLRSSGQWNGAPRYQTTRRCSGIVVVHTLTTCPTRSSGARKVSTLRVPGVESTLWPFVA